MGRYYGSKTYQLNKKYTIECVAQNTSYGFRHLCDLFENGQLIASSKACYYNRSWEAYEYQSVIHDAIDNSSMARKNYYKKKIDNIATGQVNNDLKNIGLVMSLGDVFTENKAESNDWKTRMLKAGLGDSVNMPEDWNELTEDEKQSRLNKVVKELTS